MIKYRSKSEYVLGISTSTRKIEAVLIHNAATGPVIIRSFTRKRNGSDHASFATTPDTTDLGPDVTFEVGGGPADMDSLFLASEFGTSKTGKKDAPAQEMAGPGHFALPCDVELQDIVAECADAGYDNVRLAFALSTENLGTALVQVPQDPEGKEKKKLLGSRKSSLRDTLLAELTKAHAGKITDSKTTFIPLSGESKKGPSHMAIFSLPSEPVTVSLQAIRDRKRPFPNVALMDTEPTLMLGLARAALLTQSTAELDLDAEPETPEIREESTVLVRVGAEDTLVLFLKGDKLMHFESLRSITAFDPAETICSRILLMHDEFGITDANNMLLFSDIGESNMFNNLSQFFPETRIRLLRDVLPHSLEETEDPMEKEGLLATSVALRLVRDELFDSVFPEVDFLDPKLKGRGFQLPFSWPVAAMIIMLFASTLFFVHRYFSQNHELEMTRYELKNFPEAVISENSEVLQARIDSLKSRSEGFIGALDLLDSLLIGSDRWSRALERTSINTENITGLWIERWEENTKGTLSMSGTATDRNQIVVFASKSGANIENLEFSSIRGVPVYTFTMSMPLKNALPEAAVYLREHALDAAKAMIESPDFLETSSTGSGTSLSEPSGSFDTTNLSSIDS